MYLLTHFMICDLTSSKAPPRHQQGSVKRIGQSGTGTDPQAGGGWVPLCLSGQSRTFVMIYNSSGFWRTRIGSHPWPHVGPTIPWFRFSLLVIPLTFCFPLLGTWYPPTDLRHLDYWMVSSPCLVLNLLSFQLAASTPLCCIFSFQKYVEKEHLFKKKNHSDSSYSSNS